MLCAPEFDITVPAVFLRDFGLLFEPYHVVHSDPTLHAFAPVSPTISGRYPIFVVVEVTFSHRIN